MWESGSLVLSLMERVSPCVPCRDCWSSIRAGGVLSDSKTNEDWLLFCLHDRSVACTVSLCCPSGRFNVDNTTSGDVTTDGDCASICSVTVPRPGETSSASIRRLTSPQNSASPSGGSINMVGGTVSMRPVCQRVPASASPAKTVANHSAIRCIAFGSLFFSRMHSPNLPLW